MGQQPRGMMGGQGMVQGGWQQQQQQQQPYMEMKQPLGTGYTGMTGTPLTTTTGLGTNIPSSNLGGSFNGNIISPSSSLPNNSSSSHSNHPHHHNTNANVHLCHHIYHHDNRSVRTNTTANRTNL